MESTLPPKGLGRGFSGLPTLKRTILRDLAGLEKGKNAAEKWIKWQKGGNQSGEQKVYKFWK